MDLVQERPVHYHHLGDAQSAAAQHGAHRKTRFLTEFLFPPFFFTDFRSRSLVCQPAISLTYLLQVVISSSVKNALDLLMLAMFLLINRRLTRRDGRRDAVRYLVVFVVVVPS